MIHRKNLTVVMDVAGIGDFESILPLTQDKAVDRFRKAGQPPLMGNHLYTSSSDNVFICALRSNNGTIDKNSSNHFVWRGIVRYNSYKLVAPIGYVIVTEDGIVGNEIVLHVGATLQFLPRATIQNRFAVCTPELVALAKLKLVYKDQPHEWQPIAGNYGPSQLPLPSTGEHDYEAMSAADYQQWLQAWKTGNPIGHWESQGRRIGPKMPAGDELPYMFGGDGIDPNHGYEQCRSNVLLRRWKHSRWMDRMNCAIFDADGNQMTVNSFASPEQIASIQGAGQWQGTTELPIFLVGDWAHAQYPHFNPGQVDHENELWQYPSVWISHYIRAIQHGIAVWEYTHDPMIADDLLMLFEDARFRDFADRGDEIEHEAGYTPPSLNATLYGIAQWPNQGTAKFDRAYGWAMYLGAQVNRMGYPRIGWLRKMTLIGDRAMMPNGIISRNYNDAFPAGVQGVQTFHEMIIAIGYHAACTQLGRSPATKLIKMCTSILDNPYMPPIDYEYASEYDVKGPPHWIWTHQNNNVPVRITSQHANGGGDPAHVMQVLALAYLATEDPRWLNVSLKHWFVAATLQQKLEMLQGRSDKSWGGTLQAVLESTI